MQKFQSAHEILDFAIAEEAGAVAFYRELAGKMARETMRRVFEGFAQEEERHHAKLLAVKAGETPLIAERQATDLKIGDYLIDIDPAVNPGEFDYQQALIIAMKKEKAAFKLYTRLAEETPDAAYRAIFLGLAQEEAKHKLRFELEYDEEFLTEI